MLLFNRDEGLGQLRKELVLGAEVARDLQGDTQGPRGAEGQEPQKAAHSHETGYDLPVGQPIARPRDDTGYPATTCWSGSPCDTG